MVLHDESVLGTCTVTACEILPWLPGLQNDVYETEQGKETVHRLRAGDGTGSSGRVTAPKDCARGPFSASACSAH